MVLKRIAGERGGWLTAFLVYAALSNAWWAYRAFRVYEDLVSHRAPRVPHWPYLVLGILSALAVLAVVGLWRLRRWGLVLYLVCWAAALGIGVYLGVPFLSHLLSLVNVFLLYLFVAPRRDLLR